VRGPPTTIHPPWIPPNTAYNNQSGWRPSNSRYNDPRTPHGFNGNAYRGNGRRDQFNSRFKVLHNKVLVCIVRVDPILDQSAPVGILNVDYVHVMVIGLGPVEMYQNLASGAYPPLKQVGEVIILHQQLLKQ
jgi:hypothetical protein